MTTLAIIGGGIAGRSLLYSLTTEGFSFKRVVLFESETFAFPCSKHSTAIVAPRGVTPGHSPLGDLIFEGLEVFREHVEIASPAGVAPMVQYSGSLSDTERFLRRYPGARLRTELNGIPLKEEILFNEEDGFQVRPEIYLPWLLQQGASKLPLEVVNDFVMSVEESKEGVSLKTQSGQEHQVQHVVFAAGAGARFWKGGFSDPRLKAAKPVQGAYLEFRGVRWEHPSFSVTLEGKNLVYRREDGALLLGNSSHECHHVLGPRRELSDAHRFFESYLDLTLPPLESGQMRVGTREKSSKRSPYVFTQGQVSFIGGLYKNGYILSLRMTRSLARQLRGTA